MPKKFLISALILLYSILALFFFVQNNLSAKEDVVLKIIEKEKIIEEDDRAMLRAYYSAPPVIPHEVEKERDSKDCLRCHLNVTKLEDGRVAMATPHPKFYNCMQCHAPTTLGKNKDVSNKWQGLKEPKRGDRWFWVSPPTIPHRVFMRENCLSCHGPENPNMKIRTPHPERTSCLQCHVPDYKRQF